MLTDHHVMKLNDVTCLKFRLAIVDKKIKIRFNSLLMQDVELAIIGTENEPNAWVNMHALLMSNDWDTTFIGKYDEISYAEEIAVLLYVSDTNDYVKVKGLFFPNTELDGYIDGGIASLSSSLIGDEKGLIEKHLRFYLNNLILMQSAYNKARMLAYSKKQAGDEIFSTEMGVEVYRNVNDGKHEMQGYYSIPGSTVIAASVASTTKDKAVYNNRNVKFIIEAGNEAIPLFDIIQNKKLRSTVIVSEQEHFLGVRPIFIALDNKPNPDATQIEYKLHHVSQAEMTHIKNIQRFFRKKLHDEQDNETVANHYSNKAYP
jgi:hypothetical protein